MIGAPEKYCDPTNPDARSDCSFSRQRRKIAAPEWVNHSPEPLRSENFHGIAPGIEMPGHFEVS